MQVHFGNDQTRWVKRLVDLKIVTNVVDAIRSRAEFEGPWWERTHQHERASEAG